MGSRIAGCDKPCRWAPDGATIWLGARALVTRDGAAQASEVDRRRSAFHINLNLPKIEVAANSLGFTGPDWKHRVLDDLLHDGELLVQRSHDPRDATKTVWYCYGKRLSLACVPDQRVLDALFCIGLIAHPRYRDPAAQFLVAGPWRVHTLGWRSLPPITAEAHLLKCAASPMERVVAPSMAPAEVTAATPATKEMSPAPDPLPPSSPKSTNGAASTAAQMAPVAAAPTIAASVSTKPGKQATSTPTAVLSSAHANSSSLAPPPSDGLFAELPPPPVDPVRAAPSMNADANPAMTFAGPTPASEVTSAELPVRPAMNEEPLPNEDPWDAASPLSFPTAGTWNALALSMVTRARPYLIGLLEAPNPLEARRERISRLEAEISRLQTDLLSVPSEACITEADEIRRRLEELGTRLAPNPPHTVTVAGPVAFEELLRVLADEALHNLPYWALTFNIHDLDARARVLSDPSLQERLLTALRWTRDRFAGAPPQSLQTVLAPDAVGGLDELLEVAWKAEEAVAASAGGLPASCLPILRAQPATRVAHVAKALNIWQVALDPAAFAELISGEARAFAPPVELHVLESMSADDRAVLKDVRTLDRVRHFLGHTPMRGTALPPPQRAQIVDFAHVLTDERGTIVAASIVVPSPDPGVTFVLLDFPLRLIASGSIDSDVEITVTSPALSAVSRDATLPDEVQIRTATGSSAASKLELRWKLQSNALCWRPIESERFSHETVLHLPVTRGEAKNLREGRTTRIAMTLVSGAANTTLTFTRFLKEVPGVAAGTGVGAASATDSVRERPLGAQVQHQKVEGVVTEGRLSFMVVAPRRFGKSTLFLHLIEHARKADHAVIGITLERDLTPEAGTRQFWERFRHECEITFHASPALGAPANLTDEGAWAGARRFARAKGYRCLVVLIDEAQTLVPRHGGTAWGNHFKNFVERSLFESSDELASVQIGLFGTVDLSVRIGQNCRDFLLMHGTEQYAFDEASLARFIRTVGQGTLLSSKAARLELALWTSNLRTLSSVFDQIRSRILRRQHAFMIDRDVKECISEILSSDDQTVDHIWKYARAELSYRDDWEPIDSFPLAVAWARASVPSTSQSAKLDDCVVWLGEEFKIVPSIRDDRHATCRSGPSRSQGAGRLARRWRVLPSAASRVIAAAPSRAA